MERKTVYPLGDKSDYGIYSLSAYHRDNQKGVGILRLSISNIAWDKENDEQVYHYMKECQFEGLEIAPTRILPDSPYDKLREALEWKERLSLQYGFSISSIQSIWYGRKENLFGTMEERDVLKEYTKKAIDFASYIGCKNLVFGCPKNRFLPEGADSTQAIPFFKELGDYASKKGTVIGMEANPPLYNTNYINGTFSALELIEQVDSDGFKLNLDVGTMIVNDESVMDLKSKVKRINHVHISEPCLRPIDKRTLHFELKDLLLSEGYKGFISIEMGKVEDLSVLRKKMEYVAKVFMKQE